MIPRGLLYLEINQGDGLKIPGGNFVFFESTIHLSRTGRNLDYLNGDRVCACVCAILFLSLSFFFTFTSQGLECFSCSAAFRISLNIFVPLDVLILGQTKSEANIFCCLIISTLCFWHLSPRS